MSNLPITIVLTTIICLSSCSDGEGDWGAEPGTDSDNGSGGGSNLASELYALHAKAESGGEYTIELTGSGQIGAQPLSFSGKTNITVRLKSNGTPRTIIITDKGSLFTVGSGVTLILDDGVTLLGHNENNAPLVKVNGGGILIMKNGAKIMSNAGSDACGVSVAASGNFVMEGGEISGNTNSRYSSSGGGVYIASGADFLMSGGKISGNAADYGSGVYVAGNFNMEAGEISSNTASASGGGVYVDDGGFKIAGGKIFGNTAKTTSSSGGGGGVYVEGTTFTMVGGEIAFNTANSGGGVFVAKNAGIYKTGGIIYGYKIGDSNRNTATAGVSSGDKGHAVFVNSSPGKRRENTAEIGLILDSDTEGAGGGWE